MPTAVQTFDLATGWRFRRTDEGDDAWMPVEKVPTVVHLDLINNKKIPDPFLGTNELDVEWIGEHSWTYEKTFNGPFISDGSSVYLLFEGLDTFATARLNDVTILESDNMFLSHRVDITAALKPSAVNKLVIDFDSALLRGRELQKQHPDHKYVAFNGETSRLCVRKAQYHWGWDWGPVLMTAGPWRPVRLEVSSTHIDSVRIDYDVVKDLSFITGSVVVNVEGPADEITLVVSHGDEEVLRTSQEAINGTNTVDFDIDHPLLWYPYGYGEQSLYQFTVQATFQGTTCDTWRSKTGFRKSELIQEADEHGESFYFRVNNIDVFCGGSCWIPADSLLPRIGPEKYRSWLELMREGNQVMIRVWGGGIYEDDIFYDICDELGILVWQDLMFACGVYPVWPELKDSIEAEARDNIRRLRHHPSIVIWAGNNEDYQVQEQCHLEYDYDNKDPEAWLRTSFPGRYYYEHLLPAVMEEEAPGTQYWPGSPFSNGKLSSDLTAGDLHQWNVWHGIQEKYQRFDQIGGRFNSEFGMAAFPVLQTIKRFVTNEKDLYPQSRVLDFHNKADGHERRIGAYVLENFHNSSNLATWAYLTQLAQSEALTYAYRGWRCQWGENRRCGGALVWQLNDCWPATSWSIVDYDLRKKPSFYTIKRALLSLAVGVQREHHDWSVCHARPAKTSSYKVWISSSLQDNVSVDLELRFISINTGKEVKPAVTRNDIIVTSNGTTDVLAGEVDNIAEEDHVLAARIFQNSVCVSRDVDWPQPLKYLCFENRRVKVETFSGGISITSERPTKGLVIEESDEYSLSDNCLDIMPGDCQVVNVRMSTPRLPKLGIQYLGMDQA
ncbi:related to beta-mannosidase [Fusarium torulosum]|uniref:Beta-mannosidase B n=1 Tax=Fusarium torulosum TaxID=33205 RepID=A0AAE8MBS9_9HYPO|nr:related to beta-mannosidase [Fusarium torulosum]